MLSWERAWRPLPNSEYIQRLFQHARDNPQRWRFMFPPNLEWAETLRLIHELHRDTALEEVWRIARRLRSSHPALATAATTLLAWDDVGYMMDTPPDAVKLMAELDIPAASLMYEVSREFNQGADDGDDSTRAEGA